MNIPYPGLLSVEPVAPYRLKLRFADGVTGTVDLSNDLWGEMFEPLKDPEYFAQVRLDEDGAPAWPNGLDLAPDALYEDVVALAPR
ncbi:MAG: DUF2442 domain-containing protein [Candidatus Dormibacteria bacterium]